MWQEGEWRESGGEGEVRERWLNTTSTPISKCVFICLLLNLICSLLLILLCV